MAEDHGHGGSHGRGHESKGAHGSHGGSHGHDSVGKREPLIFILILGGILLIPVSMIFVLKLPVSVALLTVLVLLGAAIIAPRIYEVKEYEKGVVFKFGKYERTIGAGWHILFPLFHKIELVDSRTQMLDIPPQEVITKEDLKLNIDAIAYIRIVDAKKAVIEVKDVRAAAATVLHGELVTQIAKLPLQDVLEKIEELNTHLHNQMKKMEDAWGITVVNVEISNIKLPHGLEEAIRKREEAHEYKQKLEIEATARREAIRIVAEATSDLNDSTMAYLYMETLKKMADGRSSKIIYPMELSALAESLGKRLKGGANSNGSAETLKGLAQAYLAGASKTESPAGKKTGKT